MSYLKTIAYVIISLVISGCSGSSGTKPENGEVTYNEPVPGDITEAQLMQYADAVKAFYDTNLVNRGFNGAILVAKKGRIIFEQYHGYSDLDKKDTLTEHSAFHLASTSKTFTAMAVLKLAELGKLKIDDDLALYFPGFPYQGITIRMLLTHRSGLPNYLYFMQELGWDKKMYCTNNDVLDYMIRFQPKLTHTPGTHFSYCNTNYCLLALIIEKVSGQSYADFLQHHFFTPLKMYDTYVFKHADSARAMPSFNWKGQREPLTFLDLVYGDKNIYSTARDLLKWDQALYNNQLFTRETIESAFRPYSNEKPGIRNYGFGWRMNIYPNGKKIIFHGGWWHGNNTMLMRLIQDSATIIILGNKYNRNIYDAKKMANIFSEYFTTDEEDSESKQGESESPDTLTAGGKKKRNRSH